MTAKPVPDGFHTVTPYLTVADPAALIDFLVRAFGAEEVCRFAGPGGWIMHAQVRIGGSVLMMSGSNDRCPSMPAAFYLYVVDADALFSRALAAGGQTVMPIGDQFWGDRMGTVADPQGNQWSIATHIEDVPPEDMQRRAQSAMAGCSA